MNNINVAKEIQAQLMAGGKMVVFSWGAHAYKGIAEGQMVDSFGQHRGALVFKVQGKIFNGHVAVVLMPSDTYTVRLGRLVKGKFITKQELGDVYCDQLTDVVDSKVETA